MNYLSGDNVQDKTISEIARNEIKYLRAGMEAIADSPALSGRFGNGFEGALAVSGVIKSRASEQP